MAWAAVQAPDLAEVTAFLGELHGTVHDVQPLSGGFWSAAFGYRAGDQELVARFGTTTEGFEADRAAMAYAGPDLPVPRVLQIGEAGGRCFAISERHQGRFLEDAPVGEASVTGPTLVRLLAGLLSCPPAAATRDWHAWLLSAFADSPESHTAGWREAMREHSELEALLAQVEQRVTELLPACPQRADLVHGDLLHQNVLVRPDGSEVTAVFSWKCSVRGDFLYDTAWCTFWSPWYPGIAAVDLWSQVLGDPRVNGEPGRLVDAAVRHHCYELQIGAGHFAWYLWTKDQDNLRAVAARTAEVLERGPLSSC